MPVKRKLNKKRTKVPRNVKINSKSSKRVSQKKRGRSGRGRKSQRGGVENEYCSNKPNFTTEQINKILTQANKKTINDLIPSEDPTDLYIGLKDLFEKNLIHL